MINFNDLLITRLNRSLPVKIAIFLAMTIGWLLPPRNRSALFFFFPFCHVGGAERVHADIVECFTNENPWIFFTKKSDNEKFRPFFRGGRTFNLWCFCKFGYPFSIGILAGFINRHRRAVVFGGNSLVYYLLLPYLRPEIRKVDLLHAFGAGIEEYSLATAPMLDKRVVINGKTGADLHRMYHEQGMPAELHDRITLISNRVSVPLSFSVKGKRERLSLLYVGRGGEEKRVHLIGRLATQCRNLGLPVDVLLAGDTTGAVAHEDHASCSFLGEISDAAEMARLYDNADILLLTSLREGFPLVIMEAMAHGVVPLTTAVGGIPEQVTDGINGWLIHEIVNEELIVTSMRALIERICAERRPLAIMSRAAHDHAREHFDGKHFCDSWRKVLTPDGRN